jgi:hypothetical protein
MSNNEMIWKLLQYESPDAWSMPNLTQQEKSDLIYNGQINETDYHVFFDVGQDQSWTIQTSILRISVLEVNPLNYIYGNMTISFEVYSHYKISHLSNYTTRVDTITQQLIKTFNGSEIGGFGRLYFDQKASYRTKVMSIGQIPFKGKALLMCNYIDS